MLFWKPDGSVAGRELYRVSPNPREEGFDIAEKEPARADAMQKTLLDFLKSVNAETPKDKMKKRKPKAKAKK